MHLSASNRWAAFSIALLASALPTALFAAPLLRCQIDQGGSNKVLDVSPVSDPYGVSAIDINGRFRFKAVMIGDAQHMAVSNPLKCPFKQSAALQSLARSPDASAFCVVCTILK